jgi:hypothetical protein
MFIHVTMGKLLFDEPLTLISFQHVFLKDSHVKKQLLNIVFSFHEGSG